MKTKRLIEISKKMNMNTSDLIHDLSTISNLSSDFKNKLDEIILTASINVDKNITSYNEEKEEWLKILSEEQLNEVKQDKLNKLDYYTFLREWLDYPEIEASIKKFDLLSELF